MIKNGFEVVNTSGIVIRTLRSLQYAEMYQQNYTSSLESQAAVYSYDAKFYSYVTVREVKMSLWRWIFLWQ